MKKNILKKQSNTPLCPNCFKNVNVSLKYKLDNKFSIFYCFDCEIGITYPVPKKIEGYYHANYWVSPGLIGTTKDLIFYVFQKRRLTWVKSHLQKGKILDIGSGEGNFAKGLPHNYTVTCVDSPKANIQNPNVIKIDFTKWNSKRIFDAVTFWESLEHTTNPPVFLKKSCTVINKNGIVFIEYPRFNSLESKIFGKHWFHLDTPRHSFHLTDKGLSTILKRAGFTPIETKSVPAFEYTLWGFCASILDIFGIKPTDQLKKMQNLFIIVLLIPLVITAAIFELTLISFNQSPIGLIVARKK